MDAAALANARRSGKSRADGSAQRHRSKERPSKHSIVVHSFSLFTSRTHTSGRLAAGEINDLAARHDVLLGSSGRPAALTPKVSPHARHSTIHIPHSGAL
jgi:hypothetical protein